MGWSSGAESRKNSKTGDMESEQGPGEGTCSPDPLWQPGLSIATACVLALLLLPLSFLFPSSLPFSLPHRTWRMDHRILGPGTQTSASRVPCVPLGMGIHHSATVRGHAVSHAHPLRCQGFPTAP